MNGLRIAAAVAFLAMGLLVWSGCSKKTQTEESQTTETIETTTEPVMKVTPHHAMPAPYVSPVPAEPAAQTQPATAPAVASEPATAPVSVAPAVQPPEPATPEMVKMEEQFGLVVMTVTARQKAIEVVFQVSGPEKAGPVLSPNAQRYLVDQKSGKRLTVPSPNVQPGRERRRVSSLRPMLGSNSAQRGYVVVFDNSEGLIQPGDKVTLIMDQYQVEDLTVR